VRRMLADRLGRPRFDDDPEVHDRDLVGDLPDHRQVMRDEQVGHVPLPLQIAQQVEDAGLDAHVQRGDRLVQDQDPRPQRQRPGDADALPLPAGELAGEPDGCVRVKAHGRQQLTDPVWPARDLVYAQRLTDDFSDREPWIERGVGILEHHLQVPPQWPQPAIIQARELGAVQLDAARGRLLQPHEQPGHRGLAAAGFPDQAEAPAGLEIQADAADRVHGGVGAEPGAADPEVLRQVTYGEHRSGRLRPRLWPRI
jgi:hypothetical protein